MFYRPKDTYFIIIANYRLFEIIMNLTKKFRSIRERGSAKSHKSLAGDEVLKFSYVICTLPLYFCISACPITF